MSLECLAPGCRSTFGTRHDRDVHVARAHKAPDKRPEPVVIPEVPDDIPDDVELDEDEGLGETPAVREDGPVSEFKCGEPGCGREFASKQGVTMHTTRSHRGLGNNGGRGPASVKRPPPAACSAPRTPRRFRQEPRAPQARPAATGGPGGARA